MDDNIVAVDIRSVTITGSTALISIPGAQKTITADGQPDNLTAQIKVTEDDDTITVTATIDKPSATNDNHRSHQRD